MYIYICMHSGCWGGCHSVGCPCLFRCERSAAQSQWWRIILLWRLFDFGCGWVMSICEWVTSYVWVSHVTHVLSHATHLDESCHACEQNCATHILHVRLFVFGCARVSSHMCMSNVTHVNESPRTYECVTAHMWMGQVTRVNASCHTLGYSSSSGVHESCHTCAWVTSHMWMSHVTHMNESRHTREGVTPHIWMRDFTHSNVSCHACKCVVSHASSTGYTLSVGLVTNVNESRHTTRSVMSRVKMSRVTHILNRLHSLSSGVDEYRVAKTHRIP